MKIVSIEAIPVEIPLKPERRMISALGRHDVSHFVLVRLRTDDGLEGVGEATVTPRWSGETVWGCDALIKHVFTPALLDVDPLDRDEVMYRLDALAVDNWFAKSAIEMACWDLAGKVSAKPIFELLGGACRPLTIRNRFSLGAYSPSVARERARDLVAAGFDTIKIKVGTVPRQDVERVLTVRDEVGPDIRLTIDANGGWNEKEAFECLDALSDCRLTLVEQPLPRGNYTGLKNLREATGAKILADESCFDLIHAQELIEHECCDVISLYPGKQGGIAKARQIADVAAQAGIACTIGSNLEWDVATSAMLHFIVSTPNMRVDLYPGDCLGPFYHEFPIVHNPVRIEGPWTSLDPRPGLGVDVDWNRVELQRMDRLH